MANLLDSKLPAAQQARREQLQAEEAARTPTVVTEPLNNAPPTPQNTAPALPSEQPPTNTPPTNNTPDGPQRISDADIDQLRANATAADNRARLLELELAEARQRPPEGLTSAPDGSKAVDTAPAPSGPADRVVSVDSGDVNLSDTEKEEYGDAEPIISKVARREIKNLLDPILAKLEARFNQLETGVRTVSDTTVRNTELTFVDQVKSKVGDFDKTIRHPKWAEFMESRVPTTSMKYKDSLAAAHSKRELDVVAEIFETFKKAHVADTATPAAGYDSIDTSATGGGNTLVPPKEGKLAFSERQKASEDFMKGRITREQLDAIKEKFRVAEESGNIDYDN